jgi:uncharacterized protein (UPF0335 family)
MKKLDPSIADEADSEPSAAEELRAFVERLIALDAASMALDEQRRLIFEAAKSRGIVRRRLKAAYRQRRKLQGDPDADLAAYAKAVGATIDIVDEEAFGEIVRGSSLWPLDWLQKEMESRPG